MKRKCKIKGCRRAYMARGFCKAHYKSKYYNKKSHYRTKLTSQDILTIRQAYIQGLTAVRIGQKIGADYPTICAYFAKIRLTKKELLRMYVNLHALHRRYDKLRSFKSPKEREIEAIATIICRRMDRQEERKFIGI